MRLSLIPERQTNRIDERRRTRSIAVSRMKCSSENDGEPSHHKSLGADSIGAITICTYTYPTQQLPLSDLPQLDLALFIRNSKHRMYISRMPNLLFANLAVDLERSARFALRPSTFSARKTFLESNPAPSLRYLSTLHFPSSSHLDLLRHYICITLHHRHLHRLPTLF